MSRTYWMARALRSFGYAGLIVCGWVMFIQFVNGRAEPTANACSGGCECSCGPVGLAAEIVGSIFFIHLIGWSLALIGINLGRAYDFLFQSSQPSFTTRLFPAAVIVTPHFMENRNWGKTLPVLSRPFLGEFLTENPRISRPGWAGRAFLSGIGAGFFIWLTFLTARIGIKDLPFFDGHDGCGYDVMYVPPQIEMVAFVNYTLFLVFLGITIVLIGQTRDFLLNARLSKTDLAPAGMERRA